MYSRTTFFKDDVFRVRRYVSCEDFSHPMCPRHPVGFDVITNTSFQRGCLSCAKVCLGCKNVFCMFRVNICFFPRYVHVSCKHEHIFSFLDMKHICLYLFFPRYDIFSFLDMKHICCMFTQKRKRKDMFMFTQKHIFSFLDMKHIFAKTCFACFV